LAATAPDDSGWQWWRHSAAEGSVCNYEQTALNKARLFAPIEYLFATKAFTQLADKRAQRGVM